MQAIIMAAGKGSRLGDMTTDRPKSLVEIKGRSLLDINIAMLHKHGIRDITIVTGYMDEKIVEATKDVSGITYAYNPFYEFANVIGSYYMGMNNMRDDFVYLHADTICDVTIFEELLEAEGDIVLPVDTKPCDDEAMKVRIDNDKITKITKNMPIEEAAGEFIGIMKISKRTITDLNKCTQDVLRRKEYKEYFEAAVQGIINMNKYDIRMIDTKGKFWAEIDFLEDYERAVEEVPNEMINV